MKGVELCVKLMEDHFCLEKEKKMGEKPKFLINFWFESLNNKHYTLPRTRSTIREQTRGLSLHAQTRTGDYIEKL